MNTKLTLSIDKSVIAQAKEYAALQGRSLSDLVENYLKSVAGNPNDMHPGHDGITITPIVKSLQGAFKAPAGFDEKQELTQSLVKKYIKK